MKNIARLVRTYVADALSPPQTAFVFRSNRGETVLYDEDPNRYNWNGRYRIEAIQIDSDSEITRDTEEL